MSDNSDLLQELRQLMADGSAVSRLVREIQLRLHNNTPGRELIRAFQEAFYLEPGGLGMLQANEVTDAGRNSFVVPRIVETRDKWLANVTAADNATSWLSTVVKTPVDDLVEQARARRCELTAEGWESLSERDRSTILSTEVSRMALSEDLWIICTLLERLQQRLDSVAGSTAGFKSR